MVHWDDESDNLCEHKRFYFDSNRFTFITWLITFFSLFFLLQFDTYLRSLKIDQNNICLVTDGQLPLRQCLHPEAGAKEIHLPSYYWKFSDLKKEYVQSKSGDLSRALIPINDVSKLPNMPALPQAPATLADILIGKLIDMFSVSLASMVKMTDSQTSSTTITRI